MSVDKLKPCKCGSENLRMYAYSISADCGVVCDDCGYEFEIEVPWTKNMTEKSHDKKCQKAIIEEWNGRTECGQID